MYFQNSDTYFSSASSTVAIEISASVDLAENEVRSNNISWGIKKGLQNGSSGLYRKPCYGCRRNEHGELIVEENEAIVVCKVFTMYLNGASVLKTKCALETAGHYAQKDGDLWAKKTINNILKNAKHCDKVEVLHSELLPTGERQYYKYVCDDAHDAIISKKMFERVQTIIAECSNISINSDGTSIRGATNYSSKNLCTYSARSIELPADNSCIETN